MKTKSSILVFCLVQALLSSAQTNNIGSGISLQFNGASANYVNLNDVYNDLNFPFTLETWINIPSYPSKLNGGIFGSDNSTGNYYGFFISVINTGQIRIEFGDGLGSGQGDRRGVYTNNTIPLLRWVNIAVVCNSADDIHIYFNGVDQKLFPSDGTSSLTQVTHSNASASVGFWQDVFDTYPLNGQLDEIRLWNVARSESQIRNNLCQKLLGNETGLIGYWTADESYTSNTVLDHTSPAENGTIVGVVGKVTSGAPIGNTSVNLFTTSWKGVSLSLSSPGKDKLTVKTVKNNPYGILIYRVDSAPYSTTGLNQFTHYYYGVFTADSATAAKYNVAYHYSFKNGVVNSGNQSSSSLFQRTDNSVVSWSNANASLNQNSKQLSLTKVSSRNEYIFNINNTNPEPRSEVTSVTINAFPNPFTNQLNISSEMSASEIFVLDAMGKIVYHNAAATSDVTINTSTWSNGLYLVMLKNENQTYYRKVILNR
jgi:Concanavalin A-like lectin/glucanases superfamily/Secretion system C-terminal sorting domain